MVTEFIKQHIKAIVIVVTVFFGTIAAILNYIQKKYDGFDAEDNYIYQNLETWKVFFMILTFLSFLIAAIL